MATKRNAAVAPSTEGSKESPDAENSIRSAEQRRQKSTTGPRRRGAPIPEEVAQRFVKVGKDYYFNDGTKAFTDRGTRLTTPSENTEVIRNLLLIAEARGWSRISVVGSDRFKKEAWHIAKLSGIQVQGYAPDKFERSRSARAVTVQQGKRVTPSGRDSSGEGLKPSHVRQGRSNSKGDSSSESLLMGKLIDHGQAPYRNDPREAASYFARIETPRGEREVWGVDLERAFRESLSQPQIGQEIGLRSFQREPVTVKSLSRGANGQVIGRQEKSAHRNRWIVESKQFFQSRMAAAEVLRDSSIDPREAVQRHPELAGTYLQLRAAELAAKQFRDVEDRRMFMTRVREALADAVARGEPMQPVRLRDRDPGPTHTDWNPEQSRLRTR